jgi:hypothetical protein
MITNSFTKHISKFIYFGNNSYIYYHILPHENLNNTQDNRKYTKERTLLNLNHEVLVQYVTNTVKSRRNRISIPISLIQNSIKLQFVMRLRKDNTNWRSERNLHFKHPSKSFISFRIFLHCQGNIHPCRSNLLKGFLIFCRYNFIKKCVKLRISITNDILIHKFDNNLNG